MITEETISRVKSSLQATKSFLTLEGIERFEKENAGLKKNLERYSQKIAEQEETIDAQDDKINFYVSKMNENILKRQELEKENAELKERIREIENDSNNCEHWSYERIKELEQQIESMKKTLIEISEYADEKAIYNVAQKELDKWG